MAMDLPPSVQAAPAYVASAPECRYLTTYEAQQAFERLKGSLPGTAFSHARPSEVCGLVRVQLANGKVAYTDATGRFLLLAFALDTHRGGPADNQEALDKAFEERERFPDKAIPGVMPRPAPVEGPLMSPIPPQLPVPPQGR